VGEYPTIDLHDATQSFDIQHPDAAEAAYTGMVREKYCKRSSSPKLLCWEKEETEVKLAKDIWDRRIPPTQVQFAMVT
jgi:hypothetical protein